ncbi:MAG: aspartyl protease family protein [Cyclobacteriaceae bacterium]|nr:aspartyl protease family protein [Cyclobacteriaceae bacterium]
MRIRHFLLGLILSISVVGHAQLGFHLKPGQRRVEFPIEIVNNLIIVPVVLNGQLPLKFILDTGVRTTILTEKAFSDILNLPYSRKYQVSGPGGEKIVEAYITNNVSLDMPGIKGQGHAMLVLEQDYLELRNYLGTDVQGILGYEVFSRFVVEIDYQSRRLMIASPEFYKPKRSFQELPIHVEDTKPYVQVPVTMRNGKVLSSKLLIDTGASHGLVLDPISDSAIFIPEKHITSIIGRGIGGVINGKIARVNSIQFGQYKLNNVIANFPNPDDYGYTDSINSTDVFRNGAVGGELLRRFTVVFNFPMEKMYMKKNAAFGMKFEFNLSGLTFKAKGARLRRYEITDVRKGSCSADAGLQVGDELISINGLPAAEFDLNAINYLLEVKPGRRLRLEILREGKVFSKKLILVNQI